MSEIALGAGKRGAEKDDAVVFEIMDRYVELGGNSFDTARVYGDGASDAGLGRWLKSRGLRDSVTIVSKGSHPDRANMFVPRLSRAEIEQDLNESLRYMGTDHSDLHLLHRDDIKTPVSEIVSSLDALVKAGKTRAVGVSNWTVSRIAEANRFAKENGFAPISCCQMHFSLAQTTAPATGDLTHVPMNDIEFGWYKESRLPVMAFSVQARGWFSVRAAGGTPKDSPTRYYDGFPENFRRLERLQKLAGELGKSLAAVTTAYARDSGINCVPLCAFSSVAQLEESLEALSFMLTPAQARYLETGE